jgi:signal transduction histidine kinase
VLHTEKLSALGRMAAGIAHEINNPLAGILLYCSNMLKKVPKEDPLNEALQIILQETVRCKGIIQGLLEFSRESEPKAALEDINSIIEKALHILENEFSLKHIHLEKRLLKDIPEIMLDRNQMEQVFINLFLNAIHAIDDGGKVTVRTYLTLDRNFVKIEISDTGCGIPQEHLSKIFEPFFSTTKNGTGLGLAVSYGILRKHQGNISVSSRPGKGTLVMIQLPISQDLL